MITAIRIKNFKCFEDTGPTDLKPVTLLFGKNGSGKTSFLDAVYLLRQTLEDPDISSAIVGDGNTFKFGHYSDYVYGHNVHREIEMSFRFSLEEAVSEELDLGEKRKRPGKLSIQEEVDFSLALRYNRKAGRIQVARMQIGDAKRRFVDVQYDVTRKVSSLHSDLLRDKGLSRARKLFKHEDLYHFLPPGDLTYRMTSRDSTTMYMWQWVSHVAVAAQMIHSDFSDITYLGPLRDYPKRTYVRGGGEPVSVGYMGSQALTLLYLRSRKRGDNLSQAVDRWLQDAHLCQKLIFEHEGQTHFRPKIRGFLQEDDDLPDTGFGISQVLPVVTAVLSANEGSVLCIEQPELHLHPYAATRLADLFVKAASSKMTCIIETHSEHLLIRMQRLVAEGKAPPDQVAIYFFEKGPDGAKLRPMSIRSDGALENAPDGFFSEDYQELVEMQRSVAKGNRRT